MSYREKQIQDVVEDITGIRPETGESDSRVYKKSLVSVRNVQIVSPAYDFFLVEEEGRLNRLFKEAYPSGPYSPPPMVSHVESGKDCLERLERENIDVIIIFNDPADMTVEKLAERVKEVKHDLAVVAVGNDVTRLSDTEDIDHIFTWNGDGRIFLSIVQYVEDSLQLNNNSGLKEESRIILLIEDSVQHYSTYVHLIYEEIRKLLNAIITGDLTRDQVETRNIRRPRLVMANNFTDGKRLASENKENLIGVISDLSDEKGELAGLEFAEELKGQEDIPIIIQSSDSMDDVPKDIEYLMKSSSKLAVDLKEFLRKAIGPIELNWKTRQEAKERSLLDIESLEELIEKTDISLLERQIKDRNLIDWLNARGEFELASVVERIKGKTVSDLKDEIKRALESYKYKAYRNSILDYHRKNFGPHVKLSRIGTGALGGKARGLAFVSKLLSRYIVPDMLPGLTITVPRTIILSTEVFDKFIKQNSIDVNEVIELSDERIAARFIESSLPATVLGDLRSFVRNTRQPLIVRSSGVLEDSLSQPFAGIYASMLLPNESWDTDFRFQDVCNAIKYVYASTLFEAARNYLRSTPKNLNDERMAVILQEVVGKKHGKYFYPTISGVARSYNHYPSGNCEPECGVAYLSIGLGKNIVEGGRSYCFCPAHPKKPIIGDMEDRIKHSQNTFYSLNLQSIYRMLDMDEETSLVQLNLEDAEKHGVLRCTASTYSDGGLYPGTAYDGARVIDFSSILIHGMIPLSKAVKLILKVTEIALGYPVEIEFSIEFHGESCKEATMYILQMRSMVTKEMQAEVNIGEYEDDEILLYSGNSLGNGVVEDIRHVVYIKPGPFDVSKSRNAAEEIRKINREALKDGIRYLLIGPGRWGSTESWMGIPIQWGDIIGARAIVETQLEGRHIEPSQGSHFFHDLVSSNTGYLIIGKDDFEIDYGWLNSQKIVQDKEYARHIRLRDPLELRLDGKRGRGIVIKKEGS
ncbi:MAG: PEP/pyruvate-binding domain-containing protein [Thermoplasmata archaeon]